MGSSGKKDAPVAGRRVVLAVNGVRHEAVGADLSMSLLEFLRTRTAVRGPKLGCGEGESYKTRPRAYLPDLCPILP
jgi:indole-3-acetaldehyde oxidase